MWPLLSHCSHVPTLCASMDCDTHGDMAMKFSTLELRYHSTLQGSSRSQGWKPGLPALQVRATIGHFGPSSIRWRKYRFHALPCIVIACWHSVCLFVRTNLEEPCPSKHESLSWKRIQGWNRHLLIVSLLYFYVILFHIYFLGISDLVFIWTSAGCCDSQQ